MMRRIDWKDLSDKSGRTVNERVDIAIACTHIEVPAGLVICLNLESSGGIPGKTRSKSRVNTVLLENRSVDKQRISENRRFGAGFVQVRVDV